MLRLSRTKDFATAMHLGGVIARLASYMLAQRDGAADSNQSRGVEQGHTPMEDPRAPCHLCLLGRKSQSNLPSDSPAIVADLLDAPKWPCPRSSTAVDAAKAMSMADVAF